MEINHCYVIMPFSDSDTHSAEEWTGIFEDLFQEAWNSCSISCCRTDISRGSITKDIIERLYSCSIVFADLTDSNPNVMYELGVRHAFKKPSVMVKQKHSDIPFDVDDYNVFEYENTASGVRNLKIHLAKVIEDIKRYPNKSDNPVWDFLYAGHFMEEYERNIQNFKKIQSLKHEIENNLNFSLKFIEEIKNFKIPKDNVELQDFDWDFDEQTALIRKLEYYFPSIQSDALKHLTIFKYVNFSDDEWKIFDEIIILYQWCHFYTANIGVYCLDEVEKKRIIEMIGLMRVGMDIIDKRMSELEEK